MEKTRMTTFVVKCSGDVITHVNSYYSLELELEPEHLLRNACKAAERLGFDCYERLQERHGVPCDRLTIEALDSAQLN